MSELRPYLQAMINAHTNMAKECMELIKSRNLDSWVCKEAIKKAQEHAAVILEFERMMQLLEVSDDE